MTTSADRTTYSQRFIAFIDVVGFGSLVSESGQNETIATHTIKRVSDAILWSIDELEEVLGFKSDFIFTQFSDSFVVSVDADCASQRDLVIFTLSVLAVADHFLSSNLFLRGGISRGQLIHTPKLLFGPAMNRAYELEVRIAKVPRIILDPTLPELENLILPDHLARDADGLMYVNYFAPRKKFYLVPSFWLSIQKTIEGMPNSPALKEKRSWLVARFNEAISKFSYEEFKKWLDEYIDDGDGNNAVFEDYDELLGYARQLRRLE
jgi:hypothetical protein